MTPDRRNRFAEWSVVALVVVVLGFTAVHTRLDPTEEEVTRVAAQVRMSSPIAQGCVPDARTSGGCFTGAPVANRAAR